MVCLVAKGSKFSPLRVRKTSLFFKRLRKADPYIHILPSSCRRQLAVSHLPLENAADKHAQHADLQPFGGFVESFGICLKMLPVLKFLNSNISPSVRSSHQPVKMGVF